MALVECPECGRKNVSDTAKVCPNCGFEIREYYGSKMYKMKELCDGKKFRIVITDFYDTDTAAYAGLCEIMGVDMTYEEAMNILNDGLYVISEYDLEDEALQEASKFDRWGIGVSVVYPDKRIESFEQNTSYEDAIVYNTEELKIDTTLKIVCVLFPIVGLIIYCVNVSKSPISAKRCIEYAFAGFVVELVLLFILLNLIR